MGDDKKEKLSDLLRGAEERARRLENIGHAIVQNAWSARDFASCFRETIDNVPREKLPDEVWNQTIHAWEAWHTEAAKVESTRTLVNSFVAVTSGTGLTTSNVFYHLERPLPPAIETAETRFFQIVHQSSKASELRTSMVRLGLDVRGGNNRPAVDLLDEAEASLNRPSTGEGSPVAVLVELRECINATLSELVRRRPLQEEAKKIEDKICSIGRRCGHAGMDDSHFTRLGVDARSLMDRLSSVKQKDVPRTELKREFHQGLLFLKALLDSIDEKKLRP